MISCLVKDLIWWINNSRSIDSSFSLEGSLVLISIRGWALACDTCILFSQLNIPFYIQYIQSNFNQFQEFYKILNRSNMSDSSSPPRRYWNGTVGARYEHPNVWMNGGVRSTAPSAPWSGWDADKKRRVRLPLLPYPIPVHPHLIYTD